MVLIQFNQSLRLILFYLNILWVSFYHVNSYIYVKIIDICFISKRNTLNNYCGLIHLDIQ